MSESNHLRSINELGSTHGLEPARHRDLLMLGQLVASAEPAVVFARLVELCVPAFSDGCVVEVFQDEAAAFRISYPMVSTAAAPEDESYLSAIAASSGAVEVRTRIEAPAAAGFPGYSGTLIHTWTGPAPSEDCAAIARLLVELAVACVQQGRLAGHLQHTQNTVTNLVAALATNRRIGAAIGILMVNHKITDEQAFERLRAASQRTHRKLREIAAEVTETGRLELSQEPARR